jgi:hypothetical protein
MKGVKIPRRAALLHGQIEPSPHLETLITICTEFGISG